MLRASRSLSRSGPHAPGGSEFPQLKQKLPVAVARLGIDRARQAEGLPTPRPVPSAQGSPLRPGPALPLPLPVLTIVGESKAEFT